MNESLVKEKRILVDIDNVLSKTDMAIRKIIFEYTQGKVRLNYENILKWDYSQCADNSGNAISKEDWPIIHDKFSKEKNILGLELFPKAIEVLKKISIKFEIVVCTSRLRKAHMPTVKWLSDSRIPYDHLILVGNARMKADFGRFDFAVEDHYEQAKALASAGTIVFLMKHPWNETERPTKNIHSVADWKEIYDHLMKT